MNKAFHTSKLLCLILAAVLLLAGCGGSAGRGQPAVTVTDQAGRAVTIDRPVERIVSGYYISSSTCIALGLADRLVGVEARADSRPIYALAAPNVLQLPNVGTAKEFNLEGCIALEPDLVILPTRLRDSADILAGMGIPAILVNPETHDDLVETIRLIGRAAGAEDRAARLTEYYSRELAAVSALTGGLARKPSVYIGGNGSYLTTAPGGMYQAALIAAAGGVNAAGALAGDSWTDISYEQLIAMDPEVIVIPAEAAYSAQDILSDALLGDVAAVREAQVYQMPRDFEAWDSPAPSCTLGIRWMLCALHGEVYPLASLRADVADFYSTFYGVGIDTDLITATDN